MSTLYVDVDDTLVKWADAIEGRLVTEWEPNAAVIHYAEQWKGDVVVWSSGGEDYARMWGQRLLSHVPHTAASKFWLIPSGEDVCLDDMPFDSFKSRTIHPKTLEAVS